MTLPSSSKTRFLVVAFLFLAALPSATASTIHVPADKQSIQAAIGQTHRANLIARGCMIGFLWKILNLLSTIRLANGSVTQVVDVRGGQV